MITKRELEKPLAAYCMCNRSFTEYISAFCKHLVCCVDMQEKEAKFLFENNMSDWLAAYVLLSNCSNLSETILYAEQIGGI